MDWKNCAFQTGGNASIATISCLPIIFYNVLQVLLGLSGFVAVVMIIYAGIKYIMSSGDAKQAESAQKTLTFAIAGLVFVLIAGILINIIGAITGVECVTPLAFYKFGFSACK